MTDPNDQAFPRPTDVSGSPGRDGDHRINCEGGLTKREFMATVIFAGIAAHPSRGVPDPAAAVRWTDGLISALNLPKPPETQ